MNLYLARNANAAVVVSGGNEVQAKRIANAHFHNRGGSDVIQLVVLDSTELPATARVMASTLPHETA